MTMNLKFCTGVAFCLTTLMAITSAHTIRDKREIAKQDNTTDKPKTPSTLPDSIQMNVPINGHQVQLQLDKSDVLDATLPVFLGTDRHTFTQMDNRNKADFVVYHDIQKHASFVMWNNTDHETPTAGMRGVFDSDGDTFSMEPLVTRSSRDPDTAFDDPNPDSLKITVNGMEFTMTKVNTTLEDGDEQSIKNDTDILEEKIKEFMNKTIEEGHDFSHFNWDVELLLVVDYATFNKWLQASRAISYKARELEAIDNIRFYFAHILNGIALRYRSVDEPNFQIRVVPVGLYIAKTPAASFWTEGYGIKEGYEYTEAYKALDTFEEWINTEQANLPPFDQATLFSSNRLFNGYYNGRRRTINGLADIKGVCGYRRASINYDLGQYGSIQNGAHELGHNLGAYHDGYNNPCNSADQYIMANSPGSLTDTNFNHPLEFSYCSKNAFWEFLLYLNDQNMNCLNERQNYDTYWNFDYYLETYPGQRYTADEQCKLVYGTQSFYCGGGHRDQAICSSMYCWVPSEQKCKTHTEQRAADATLCGDKMWCMGGQCVYNSEAPKTDKQECLYGDYKDIIDTRKNYRCEDIGAYEPYRCYNEDLKAQCCETCERVAKTQQPQCEYGNRNPEYCRTTFQIRDCYEDNVRPQCCETCLQNEHNVEGCEYGDKASSCRDIYQNPSRCYKQNSTCCEACPRYATGPKGCEWGNLASWCPTIKRNDCYRNIYVEQCCQTCKPNGPQGCEYGDRSDYCTYDDCKTPSKLYDCCKTCASYINPTTTSTSTMRSTTTTTSTPATGTSSATTSGLTTIPSTNMTLTTATSPATTSGLSPIPSTSPNNCVDKDPSYCVNRIRSSRDCYAESTTCCDTCSQYHTNAAGCEYGDKYSWCDSYVRRNNFTPCLSDYVVKEGCCAVCALLEMPTTTTTTPATAKTTTAPVEDTCRDRASWCDSNKLQYCYTERTEKETCCATCKTHRKASITCPYGDRVSWCKPQYCAIEPINCCQTCQGVLA